jgi:hypothetical protein
MKEMDRLTLEELFELKRTLLAEHGEEQVKSAILWKEIELVTETIEKKQANTDTYSDMYKIRP